MHDAFSFASTDFFLHFPSGNMKRLFCHEREIHTKLGVGWLAGERERESESGYEEDEDKRSAATVEC